LLAFIPFAYPENPFTHANWEGSGVQPDLEVPEQGALEVALAEAQKLVVQGHE
jgi:retinol-binding protein 3